MRKKILMYILAAVLVLTGLSVQPAAEAEAAKAEAPLIVTIDPGHGGSDNGASVEYGGKMFYEKDLNLKIAKYMKKELETYNYVKVYLTRSRDKVVSLDQRVRIAQKHSSDLLFSVHNNAGGSAYTDGACALVSSGQYHRELASVAQAVGGMALEKIAKETTIANRGYLKRISGTRSYPNGQKADYYAIVRQGTEAGIPSLIMEHGFMTDPYDMDWLSTDIDLRTLGVADAAAVASYYGLSRTDGSVTYKKKGPRVRMLSRYWMLKDGKYYYISSKESPLTGWNTIGDSRYHFNSKGAATTGFREIGSNYYNFTERGQTQNGWMKINGKWYCFKKNGKAYRDCTKKMDGKKYKFNKKAVCTNR